jgi:hypothetical protein
MSGTIFATTILIFSETFTIQDLLVVARTTSLVRLLYEPGETDNQSSSK